VAERLSPAVKKQVEQGIRILKSGGVIAYPTDTVYGLGARFDNAIAVERVFTVKNRPRNMALPLLLADVSQIDVLAVNIPESARRLASRFWPGALTMVLHKSTTVSDVITSGSDTVALRVPDHRVTLVLIKGVGVPIVGTSANLSGKPSPVTADEVRAQLNGTVDLIIDDGRSPVGKESTIVDLTGKEPVILREGAIPADEILKVCKAETLNKGVK
jgi:L-threonylcarbamoyladenylate synthase